jgi:hypothetical protein
MGRLAWGLMVLALPALAGAGESLAEAAKKAKAARERNAKAGVKAKSYTQDDVEAAPKLANDPGSSAASPPAERPGRAAGGGTSSAGGGPAVDLSGLEAPPSSPPASAGRDEATWRARAAAARARVAAARKEYESWNSFHLVPGEMLVDAQGRPLVRTVEQLQAKVAAARRALEAAERALENLEEAARRAGVPPGWLR